MNWTKMYSYNMHANVSYWIKHFKICDAYLGRIKTEISEDISFQVIYGLNKYAILKLEFITTLS